MNKIVLIFVCCFALLAHVYTANAATTTPRVVHDPAAVAAIVREYFPDAGVMVDIARCESNFRQFTDAGNVFRGGSNGAMVGVFQFYEDIHKSPAAALGFDIETLDGNIGYAKHLYETAGVSPWAPCVPAPVVSGNELKIALLKQVVALLEQLLAMKLASG